MRTIDILDREGQKLMTDFPMRATEGSEQSDRGDSDATASVKKSLPASEALEQPVQVMHGDRKFIWVAGHWSISD